MIRFLTVGDGQIMLGYDRATPNEFRISIDGQWHTAGPFDPDTWNTILVTINATGVVVRNLGQMHTYALAGGFSGRVYLGDGFPDIFLDASSRYLIDVAGLRSRVQHYQPGGLCGDADHAYPAGDINYDCRVTGQDLVELSEQWLADN